MAKAANNKTPIKSDVKGNPKPKKAATKKSIPQKDKNG